ncbi:alanine racemase [Paenibacillus sp. OSY-SE]|uniref:alanine racemase n=1 Tax=Paenibacillus sp. OSY-SE TaxID=1196323 RepID=UPI0002FBDAD8|nr:alanine racemase [Paenibacillus sp. OSY-SE]
MTKELQIGQMENVAALSNLSVQHPQLAIAETPFLLIDLERTERNISAMAQAAAQNGVQLRPHLKTHKMPRIAQMQLHHGASGITAAKVSEAEIMVEHGILDIFIAYPLVTPSKVRRAIALTSRARIIVGVDSIAGAGILEEIAQECDVVLEVRLEIDTGLKRSGARAADIMPIAQFIAHCPHLQLGGIFTFRGALLNGEGTLDVQSAGRDEGLTMVRIADMLREAGHDIRDVSVGSTPTGTYAAAVPGVTEIRPGTYVFQDRMQVEFGGCMLDDCAGCVAVTVVSCPQDDIIIIDGGSKAFATDVQPNTPPLLLQGFGHIMEAPEAVLERLSEEHGTIRITAGHSFKVGDRLHIIPNHICSTLNLYNKAWLVQSDCAVHVPIEARGHSW